MADTPSAGTSTPRAGSSVFMTPDEVLDNLELAAEGIRRTLEASADADTRRKGRALARAVIWVRTVLTSLV